MRRLLNLIAAWRYKRYLRKRRRAVEAARMGGQDYPTAYRNGWSK